MKLVRKLTNYLKESYLELKKVSWLSKEETWELTLRIIFFSLTLAIIFGLIDMILAKLIVL